MALRRVQRIGSLVVLIVAMAGPRWAMAQPPPSTEEAVYGAWSRLVDLWALGGGPATCNFAPFCPCGLTTCSFPGPCTEIAHVSPIPVGPKQGWVHFWRAQTGRPQKTYIWQPGGSTVHTLVIKTSACTFAPESCYGSGCPQAQCGNAFCSGHAFLPDGRLVTAGADAGCSGSPTGFNVLGSYESWVFDPYVLTDPAPPGGWPAWSFIGPTRERRWYPSVLALENGDLLLTGGLLEQCSGPTSGLYSPFFEILPWNGGSLGPWDYARDLGTTFPLALPGTDLFGLYPHLQLLPAVATIPGTVNPQTGDILLVDGGHWGSSSFSYLLSRKEQDHIAAIPSQPLLTNPNPPPATLARAEENSIRFPGSTTMKEFWLVGGKLRGSSQLQSQGRVEIHSMDVNLANGPSSTWQVLPSIPLNVGRVYSQTVILPDKSLLVVGGAQSDYGVDPLFPVLPVYQPERYTAAGGWQSMAPAASHRLYHSGAILLPDATVLSTGGEDYPFYNCNNAPLLTYKGDAQIYSPPYLFWGPRPQVYSQASSVQYAATFAVNVSVPPGATLGSLVLIRPGSVTHALDFEQRLVDLSYSVDEIIIDPVSGWQLHQLTVQAPAHGRIAPPGYYMLFAVTGQGIPSVAPFIQVM